MTVNPLIVWRDVRGRSVELADKLSNLALVVAFARSAEPVLEQIMRFGRMSLAAKFNVTCSEISRASSASAKQPAAR